MNKNLKFSLKNSTDRDNLIISIQKLLDSQAVSWFIRRVCSIPFMNRTVCLLGVLLLSGPVFAGFFDGQKGSTSGKFLTLGAGARGLSLGEAYSTLADEASSLYWNPAALTQVPGGSLTVMHALYVESSFYDYAGGAYNLGSKGAFGIGGQFFSVGSVSQTDTSGNEVGSFTPQDMAVSLGYAHPLLGGALGVSGKYVQSKLLSSAHTFAVDFGVLSPSLWNDRVKLSAVITNLGGRLTYDQEGFDLPQQLKVGGYCKIHPDWVVTAEEIFPNDNSPYTALGSEYVMHWQSFEAALRAGANSKVLKDLDGLSSVSLGAGIGWDSISLDYAFLPLGNLGITHRLSISYKWGRPEGEVKEAPHRTLEKSQTRPPSMRDMFKQKFGSTISPNDPQVAGQGGGR